MPRPVDVAPPPIEIRPLPPGSNLPVLHDPRPRRQPSRGWLVLALIVTAIIAIGGLWRTEIVSIWTPTARLYEAIGLPVEPVGAGLEFRQVRSFETQQDQTPVLVVEGQIVNVSDRVRPVPRMIAVSVGPDSAAVGRWRIQPDQDRLLPGEITTFQSTLRDPNGPIAEVVVSFEGR